MSDDPRWSEAMALMEASNAAMNRGDGAECIRLLGQYCKVLERLIDDPRAAEHERAAAKEIFEDFERVARATMQDNLRALSQIANDPHADADVRTDAAKYLAKLTEQIPPASDKRQ